MKTKKIKRGMALVCQITQAVMYWPTYFILKLIFNYSVEGQENLRGLEDGPIIFASNHGSWIDGPISAASMPRKNRRSLYPEDFFAVRFLIIEEYYKWNNPFPFPLNYIIGAYVRITGSISVVRNKGHLDIVLAEPIKQLKSGEKIWIYPEGGMTKDGIFQIDKGKRGTAYLQEATGAPIVPTAIIGNFKILNLPKTFLNNTILRKKKLIVRMGKPLYLKKGTLEEKTDKIMAEIANLCNWGQEPFI